MIWPQAIAAGACTTALAAIALAAETSAPTVVHVDVTRQITVHFELSGNDAVGFTHPQRTAAEEDAVNRVMRTLSAADDWIRFNAQAGCRLDANSIAANIYRVIDPDAPPPRTPITRPVFDADFTFTCESLSSLRSLDLALIAQFPRVHQVIVDVRTPSSHHAEIVTTPNATIALTPD